MPEELLEESEPPDVPEVPEVPEASELPLLVPGVALSPGVVPLGLLDAPPGVVAPLGLVAPLAPLP